MYGQADCLAELIKYGAKLNNRDSNKNTGVSLAAYHGKKVSKSSSSHVSFLRPLEFEVMGNSQIMQGSFQKG